METRQKRDFHYLFNSGVLNKKKVLLIYLFQRTYCANLNNIDASKKGQTTELLTVYCVNGRCRSFIACCLHSCLFEPDLQNKSSMKFCYIVVMTASALA